MFGRGRSTGRLVIKLDSSLSPLLLQLTVHHWFIVVKQPWSLTLLCCSHVFCPVLSNQRTPVLVKVTLRISVLQFVHNSSLTLWGFDEHCCHMGTAIKYLVPDRVKPSFLIFDIRALWRSALSVRVSGCQTYNWRHNPVWHRMLYSYTHMATVGVKGLSPVHFTYTDFLTSPYGSQTFLSDCIVCVCDQDFCKICGWIFTEFAIYIDLCHKKLAPTFKYD